MYRVAASDVETGLGTLIHDIAFIDGRADEPSAMNNKLRKYGKSGIAGAFAAVFGDAGRYHGECAALLAQEAYRMGYLDVQRPLTKEECQQFTDLRERYEEVDVTRSEVIATFGEPSLAVDDVICYAPSDRNQEWTFFDFAKQSISRYEKGRGALTHERDDDPLLRDVRIPAPTFEGSLILTRYGKFLRWGPQWWIRQQPVKEAGPPGVREQLRAIEEADPSESLGPRRP